MTNGRHSPDFLDSIRNRDRVDRDPSHVASPNTVSLVGHSVLLYWLLLDRDYGKACRLTIAPVNFFLLCASAVQQGGLDAYIRLLEHLPADLGVAIVIVNHARSMPTLLHEILPRYTTMPVELITDRLIISPNRVFIIPANMDLHVLKGEFRLKPLSKPLGSHDVITVFLRSLTQY